MAPTVFDIRQDTPIVSVAVPTYNHAAYISKALDSILMQETSFPYEICLGEDESNDGTKKICQEYVKKHPDKIRLFLRSRKDVIYINGNATGRFNFIETLKSCRGKYTALCEGDDYWTDPLKLQKQVDILESHPDISLCHHWQEYKYEKGTQPIDEIWGYCSQIITTTEDILARRVQPKTRAMVFRNIFKEIDLPDWFSKVFAGDVPLSLVLSKYGNMYFIDEPMAVYRI
jgi:glycosyltransferase involved in cell wall biosynthesis